MGDRVDPDLEMRRLAAMSDRVRDLRRKLKKIKEIVEAQRPGEQVDPEDEKTVDENSSKRCR